MTVPTRPRALGYVRVSSYLGRDRSDALTEPMQLEKIQQWCAVADLELVEVLRDVDRSGKDFDVRGRPAFEELMRRLEAGEAQAVVVYRMSRFGRDFYETVRTVRRLRERGVVFHSASERIDLESANGRLMFNVLASFDEYELDIRREYWAETKARVMRGRGVHLGRTPHGYLRASKRPKRACDVTMERAAELLHELGSAREPASGALVPDPVVGPVVRRAFELRAGGASIAEVVALLNREAVRPDGRRWTSTQAQRMLGLRVYLGEVAQADLVVPDAHEPLVDDETFAAAQLPAPTRRPGRSLSAVFHLRGVARCAGCGFPMTGWNQPRVRADGRTDRVRVYRCVRERAGGRCEERAVIDADAVEALVRRALEPHALSLRARVEPEDLGEDDDVAAELRAVDERLRRLTGELQEHLDADLWQEAVTSLGRRRRELLTTLQQRDGRGTHDAVEEGWHDLSVAEQFEVMLSAVDAVVVRKSTRRGERVESRVRIYRAGSVAHLLPGPETEHRMRRFDFTQAPAALPLAA